MAQPALNVPAALHICGLDRTTGVFRGRYETAASKLLHQNGCIETAAVGGFPQMCYTKLSLRSDNLDGIRLSHFNTQEKQCISNLNPT